MRSAVPALLAYNKPLPARADLAKKLKKLTDSPFGFFRGTYFLYARDMRRGVFSRQARLDASGPVIGDIHTENYGTFRAVTGKLVYDINDFDDTTTDGPYELDTRRLAVSVILAALENHHRLGDGVNAAEAAVRSWLHALRCWAKYGRPEFAALEEHQHVRQLLAQAGERNRAEYLTTLAAQTGAAAFAFQRSRAYGEIPENERTAIQAAVPDFLAHCLAPPDADVRQYRLEDVTARLAGTGSLGRHRYALLFDKGGPEKSFETLRLIEWKQALDSALDEPLPAVSKQRARQVFRATCTFQLFPKRYLGYTRVAGRPFQAREIGANDERFSHAYFREIERFTQASVVFGGILARAHLLGSLGRTGPRQIPVTVGNGEDRFVNGILSFASDYAGQVYADWEELKQREDEVRRKWSE